MDSETCDQSEVRSEDGSEHDSDKDFYAAEGSVDTRVTTPLNNPHVVDTLPTSTNDRDGSGVPIFNTSAKSGGEEVVSNPQRMVEGR